jgi:CRISPR system Cascade subunit CasE
MNNLSDVMNELENEVQQIESDFFLSMIPLSHPNIIEKVKNFSNRDELHKAVMSFFPHNIPSENKREYYNILYRIESNSRMPHVLVQSQYSIIDDEYGARTKNITNIFENYKENTPVKIVVDINSIKIEKNSTKRHPVKNSEMSSWLNKVLGDCVSELELLDARTLVVQKSNVPLRVTRVEAFAVVKNEEYFVNKLKYGVGKAKAYGCGLITALPR